MPPCPPDKNIPGGGNDKLAIDKGGNLPEKVENHWYMVDSHESLA